MKRITVLLVALVLIVPSLIAQDSTAHKGKKAFVFSYTGSSFEDFGIKYWLSEQLNLTGTISFNYRSEQKDNVENSPEAKGTQYGVGIGIRYTILSYQDLSAYGLGETYYTWGNFKATYPPEAVISEYTTKSHSFVIGTGIGIEYWILERLSLSGQHSFQALFQKYTNQQDSFPASSTSEETYQLGESYLIISFYF